MKPRIFTLEEANLLLPTLEANLKRICEKKAAYARTHDALFMHELLRESEGGHAGTDTENFESGIKAMEEAIVSLEQDLASIRDLGCHLRSIDQGFVDFLGQKDGELVFFCWKLGERSIKFYHSVDGTMKTRSPIES